MITRLVIEDDFSAIGRELAKVPGITEEEARRFREALEEGVKGGDKSVLPPLPGTRPWLLFGTARAQAEKRRS